MRGKTPASAIFYALQFHILKRYGVTNYAGKTVWFSFDGLSHYLGSFAPRHRLLFTIADVCENDLVRCFGLSDFGLSDLKSDCPICTYLGFQARQLYKEPGKRV